MISKMIEQWLYNSLVTALKHSKRTKEERYRSRLIVGGGKWH